MPAVSQKTWPLWNDDILVVACTSLNSKLMPWFAPWCVYNHTVKEFLNASQDQMMLLVHPPSGNPLHGGYSWASNYIWPLLSRRPSHTLSGHCLLWKVGQAEARMAWASQHVSVWGDGSSSFVLKLMGSVWLPTRPLLAQTQLPDMIMMLKRSC